MFDNKTEKGKNPPKTLKQLDLRPNQPKITGQTGHKYGLNRAKITGKIRPKTQAKSSQKHGRTPAKNTDQRGLNTCQKTQKISYARRLRPTLMLRGYRKESHWKSKRKAITFWILGSRERLTHVIYDFASVLALLAKESRGKFLKKLWCCVGGRV